MKIKVIIPVYNSEKFIVRCFNSILNQVYGNWEVIAVDDGSTDNSFGIMSEYRGNDGRFKIYHQENAGAGAARNYGLSVCRENPEDGYIVFVDSDDYIETDYFQKLSEHNEDIVFIDIAQKDEQGNVIGYEKMSPYAGYDINRILRKQMTGCVQWGGARKAYKSQLLQLNDVKYSTHKVGEEAVFSFKALYYAESVGFIDSAVYSYVRHEGSLSSTKLDDPWGDVAMNLKKEIADLGVYERYADTLNAFHVSAAAVSLRRLAKNYEYRQYRQKAIERINTMNERIDTQYGIDKNSLRFAALVMKKLMSLKAVSIIYLLGKVY